MVIDQGKRKARITSFQSTSNRAGFRTRSLKNNKAVGRGTRRVDTKPRSARIPLVQVGRALHVESPISGIRALTFERHTALAMSYEARLIVKERK